MGTPGFERLACHLLKNVLTGDKGSVSTTALCAWIKSARAVFRAVILHLPFEFVFFHLDFGTGCAISRPSVTLVFDHV